MPPEQGLGTALARGIGVTIEHPPLNSDRTLAQLREAVRDCQACDLWRHASQAVFGEGPDRPSVMMVGEQPGDAEDRKGRPFVGPAGQLLDRAMAAAGIDRRTVYVTNAVKHFKWEPRGKRRLHSKPNATEVRACRPWLEQEIQILRPSIIVCLGATAAQALLGPDFHVSSERGRWVASPWPGRVLATVHPSSVLRVQEDARQEAFARLVADLSIVARQLRPPGA